MVLEPDVRDLLDEGIELTSQHRGRASGARRIPLIHRWIRALSFRIQLWHLLSARPPRPFLWSKNFLSASPFPISLIVSFP